MSMPWLWLIAAGCLTLHAPSSLPATVLPGADVGQSAFFQDHPQEDPKRFAQRVVENLKRQDFPALSKQIHPTKHLRLSINGSFDAQADLVFSPAQVANFKNDPTVYTFGTQDGSGEPIRQTFAEFYRQRLYDHDYSQAPVIDQDRLAQFSNSIFAIEETYPGAHYVEFYFPGFEERYQGMDWASLVVVVEKEEGRWYLRGLLRRHWTI